jgi:DNA-binding GntR family transcriptional regulator
VLLQQYRVSRTTLREALRPLLLEGTLLSVRGKGILVAQPAIRQAGAVPVLVLCRVCVLPGGRPIEYALSVIRSDIYRYVVRLTPPRQPSQGLMGS